MSKALKIMTIPPVGRERDKMIADLKHGIGAEHYAVFEGKEIPNWSTSLDCWELWEELPFSQFKTFTQRRNYAVVYIQFPHYDEETQSIENSFQTFTGIDFFDAVTKAWIEWKGGLKNGL